MRVFKSATLVVGVLGSLVLLFFVKGGQSTSNSGSSKGFLNERVGDSQNEGNSSYDIYTCCSMAFGSCKSACENLSLVQLDHHNRNAKLNDIKRYCPLIKVDFWTCINRTLEAISRGSQWPGRKCCQNAILPRCKNVCATSSTRGGILHACRQSDELELYACIDRQVVADDCCSNARTNACFQLCRDIFEHRLSPSKEYYDTDVEVVCDARSGNAEALECIKNHTDLTPVADPLQYLSCCDQTKSDKCKSSCRNVLHIADVTQEMMINSLEKGGCGPPLPIEPFWQCFLSSEGSVFVPTSSSEVSQINQVGMDSAKLLCCHKAIAPKCRRLCQQTFLNDWTTLKDDFEIDCLLQINELELRQCIDDVEESCELGCDGLSFCSNFNNRPTELFRSCLVHADEAARADVAIWQKMGTMSLPGLSLPLRNISKCSPESWQAIACALQIKPCTRVRHMNVICREDCYQILSECMDWTKSKTGITASFVCSKLSPDSDDIPCVSLKPYMEPSDIPSNTGGHHGLTSPCKGHPCNATEVCVVHRNETVGYSCIPACTLGEASSYWVPFGSYVRIPASPSQPECLKICRCGIDGRIEHCQPVPCFSYSQCLIGQRRIDHASWFYIECNICSCFAGEITCTKKQCRIPGLSDHGYTSLPCNCPPHYVPVCGKNGNTYHSACIAKCAGLHDTEIEFGACEQQDPCKDGIYSCPQGTKCIPERQVCLSVMHRPCQQYRCVPATTTCNISEPACDTTGLTHLTPCQLLNSGSKFFHFGSCFRSCSRRGPICGINGVTYKSECEAWSDYSLMDYPGACQQVGLLTADMGQRCKNVDCDPLPSKYCQGIVPTGACCPICSGALQILFSRKQIDRALYALKGKSLQTVTLKSIFQELDKLIQITECQLSGFLSMETDLFVAVQSRERSPTRIQIEACTREAEKMATLISTQSHRITTNLALSALTVAIRVRENAESSAAISWTLVQFGTLTGICWIVLLWRNFGRVS